MAWKELNGLIKWYEQRKGICRMLVALSADSKTHAWLFRRGKQVLKEVLDGKKEKEAKEILEKAYRERYEVKNLDSGNRWPFGS